MPHPTVPGGLHQSRRRCPGEPRPQSGLGDARHFGRMHPAAQSSLHFAHRLQKLLPSSSPDSASLEFLAALAILDFLPPEPQRRLRPCLLEIPDERLDLVDSKPLVPRRLLEEKEGRERLAMDLLALEDRMHLLGELLELHRSPLLCVHERQIERHHGRVVAVPRFDEPSSDGLKRLFGPGEVAEAQGDLSLDPAQPRLRVGIPADLKR